MDCTVPLGDEELSSYLFSLSVECQLEVSVDICPLAKIRDGDLANAYKYVRGLTLVEKLALVARCQQCADSLET